MRRDVFTVGALVIVATVSSWMLRPPQLSAKKEATLRGSGWIWYDGCDPAAWLCATGPTVGSLCPAVGDTVSACLKKHSEECDDDWGLEVDDCTDTDPNGSCGNAVTLKCSATMGGMGVLHPREWVVQGAPNPPEDCGVLPMCID